MNTTNTPTPTPTPTPRSVMSNIMEIITNISKGGISNEDSNIMDQRKSEPDFSYQENPEENCQDDAR